MGLKALLSKEGRKERALAKACAKAVNKKIKPDDRQPSLALLIESGSDEAVAALLGRFMFNYDINMVSDEEEKSFVYEGLISLGDRILPALKEHLRAAQSLSWGLRLVRELCDHETTWSFLADLLDVIEPGYDRDPTRKQQLITFLGDFDDERSAPAILPFVEDHDETVRFATIEGLFKRGDEIAREPLLKILIDEEEESLRIKNRICEGFVESGWTVKGYRGSVERQISSEYTVDGKGRIKHKRARNK